MRIPENNLLYHLGLSLFILLLAACGTSKSGSPKASIEVEPKPESFWFYDSNFFVADNCLLKWKGIYFRIVSTDSFGDTYQYFKFFLDGLVIEHVIYSTPDEVLDLPRQTAGNLHGYYEAVGNDLGFTTKVYYNHNPTFYKGKIFADSLVLNQIDYEKKEQSELVFYYYDEVFNSKFNPQTQH